MTTLTEVETILKDAYRYVRREDDGELARDFASIDAQHILWDAWVEIGNEINRNRDQQVDKLAWWGYFSESDYDPELLNDTPRD